MGHYREENREIKCEKCGVTNQVCIGFIGYGPANEWETGNCQKCRFEIIKEKCGLIYVEIKEN